MVRVKLSDVTKRFGELEAVSNVNLTINDDEFFTVIGPSGCGKTTTLRLIAGLEHPTEGTVSTNDEDVTALPPQDRDITLVFQDLALFPHMTVKENIGFNLRINKRPQSEIDDRVREAAEMVQIGDLIDRDVTELSGGQRQRVALARSSVRDPGVFLLDEPLSDLDAKLKVEIRGELQQLQERLGTTMVYVTHSQEEAMTMSDRLAVMNFGQVSQVGAPMELYERPRNIFVADFIGNPSINIFEANFDEIAGELQRTGITWTLTEQEADVISQRVDDNDTMYLGIRPEHVFIADGDGDIDADVDYVEPVGSTTLVYAKTSDSGFPIRTEVNPDEGVADDDHVSLRFNREIVHYFDGEEERIIIKR